MSGYTRARDLNQGDTVHDAANGTVFYILTKPVITGTDVAFSVVEFVNGTPVGSLNEPNVKSYDADDRGFNVISSKDDPYKL